MTGTQATMAQMLREQCTRRLDAPALISGQEMVSYRQLDDRSNQVASGLRDWGIATQRRVAIIDHNSIRYFEIFFGAAKARLALVGLNTRLAAPEISWIMNDAQAEVLFVAREHYATIEQIEAELTCVSHVVALDGAHPRWPSFDEWRDRCSAEDISTDAAPGDDVVQLYTSGTTGHPKGVCHTNASWARYAEASARAWADYSDDTMTLVCMPVFHVAGFNHTLITLRRGGCVVLVKKVDPAVILALLEQHRVTDALFVPTVIRSLLDAAAESGFNSSALRTISYGASPMPVDLLKAAQQRFGCGFVHLYGLTELLGAGTYLPADEHIPRLLLSCGRAYEGLTIRIVDADGRDVPDGEVGEIIMRAPWTMRTYWGRPDATAEAVRDGWLYSGDAGRLDEEGYLYLHDRIKDMIKTGGENVYPAEVEAVLSLHPSVAEVAVIGVPDARWGEAVKAIVVLRSDAALDMADLLTFARERLAGYKLPKTVDVIAALPRNASGKVLRRQLRESYWGGNSRQIN